MIVLDTNVLSEVMKLTPNLDVQTWMTWPRDDRMAITAVTVAEVEFGLQRLPPGRRREGYYASFEAYLEMLEVLPLDAEAGHHAGRFRAERTATGLAAQPADMLIAGTVAANRAVLATRNVKDFAGLPIDLVNPWQA